MKKLTLYLFVFWLLFLFSLPLVYLRYHFLKEIYFFGSRVKGLSTFSLIFPFLTSFAFLTFSVFFSLKLAKQLSSIEKKYKRILLLISMLNLITLMPVSYLLLLSNQYANYLYSNFGFIKQHLIFFTFVSVITSVLFLFLSYEKLLAYFVDKHFFDILSRFGKWEFFNLSICLIVLCLFFYLSFSTVIGIVPKLDNDTSYDKKFGRDFRYMDLLAKFVPDNGIVIHPPPMYNFWPSIGNQVVVRYFLFPRELMSGNYFKDNSLSNDNLMGNYYFVFIPSSGDIPEWPIIKTDEKKISFDNGNVFVDYVKLEEIQGSSGVFKIYFK